ncbi:MAG: pyridoxine 5'-phosphate synthase [Gammaproteobacteria bacterium]
MKDSIALGVNIDHVATIRQARRTRYPDPVYAALMAEQAGADCTRMNLEMAVTDEMLAIATEIAPRDCCLVPERREELTTEGGLDVAGQPERIAGAVKHLTGAGIRVSLFVDPEPGQLEAARDVGAEVVELHTGAYAAAAGTRQEQELERVRTAARAGSALGLTIHAGHGLNYHNVQPVARIREVRELNIGHAIVARAIFDGLSTAVIEMKRLITEARLR